MRISDLLALIALLLLGGCGQPDDVMRAAEKQAADSSGRIECALARAAEFTRACTVDRIKAEDGLELTVRHPDGGFHRLLVTKDGRGLIAADGAEEAIVSVSGPHQIDVAIAGDRYRLPATVKGQ